METIPFQKDGIIVLDPKSSRFSQDLKWFVEAYSHAVEEEVGRTWAKGLRRIDPNGKEDIAYMLHQVVHDAHRACFFLYLKENTPVGYFIGIIKQCVGEVPNQMGYVNGIYVEPSFRGQGIGQELLEEGMQWFKTRSVTLIELHASIENEGSNRFWKRNGYRPVEQVLLKKL